MGLLSLTVEFYRINPSPCTHDDFGNPISPNAAQFPYDLQPSCGLICNVTAGPFSPMRQGSANNIYIVPAPQELTPNTATLFAAACCIPAILSLISMWNKILIINWKARFGNWSEEARMDELIEGTNGATIGRMMGVNNVVRLFLSVIEVPVFGAAVLAILIIGERNFWSTQVRYQTEPIASIGQWAPIAGTVLAALGSLYVLLANVEASGAETNPNSATIHCNCSHHHIDGGEPSDSHNRPTANKSFSNRDAQHGGSYVREIPSQNSGTLPEMQQVSARQSTPSSHSNHDDQHHSDSPNGSMHAPERIQTVDVGSRRKVRKALIAMGNFFGTAPRDWFDDSEFKRGKALDFPEIPGEEHRNRDLPQIREQYNQPRDSDGNVTPMHPEQRSRASSLHRGAPSVRDVGEGSSTPPIVRHDTLEVPSPVHHSPTRHHSSDLYFGVHE
ncbi:MAG: hypothetical protein M1822_007467 [Bathelium mastoideum]|nr:MAG: hypothetical protein M1822_007467 [Bathelium mastoideum]